jgi:hypothetical protein
MLPSALTSEPFYIVLCNIMVYNQYMGTLYYIILYLGSIKELC